MDSSCRSYRSRAAARPTITSPTPTPRPMSRRIRPSALNRSSPERVVRGDLEARAKVGPSSRRMGTESTGSSTDDFIRTMPSPQQQATRGQAAHGDHAPESSLLDGNLPGQCPTDGRGSERRHVDRALDGPDRSQDVTAFTLLPEPDGSKDPCGHD